eukprot:scaffold6030_cov199-Amphora_coffeaeformis.AAC.7
MKLDAQRLSHKQANGWTLNSTMKRSLRIFGLGLLTALFVYNLIYLYSATWDEGGVAVGLKDEFFRLAPQYTMAKNHHHRAGQQQQKIPATSKSTTSRNLKIVGFTDKRYIPVTRKWYARLLELGYQPDEIEIVCADVESVQNLTGTIPGVREMIIPNPNLEKKAKGFLKQLYMHRIRYTIDQLRAGKSMLITDVDNVFLRHVPLADFYQDGYDIIHAYALAYPQKPYHQMGFTVCAGLQWLRATPETIAFLEIIQNLCETQKKMDDKCDDQVAFNEALAGPARITWDVEPNRTDSIRTPVLQGKLSYLTETLTGRCTATNHTVKVWNRDFATRWPGEPAICPSKNSWVAAPVYDVPGFRERYPRVNFLAGKKLATSK